MTQSANHEAQPMVYMALPIRRPGISAGSRGRRTVRIQALNFNFDWFFAIAVEVGLSEQDLPSVFRHAQPVARLLFLARDDFE